MNEYISLEWCPTWLWNVHNKERSLEETLINLLSSSDIEECYKFVGDRITSKEVIHKVGERNSVYRKVHNSKEGGLLDIL